MKNITKRGFTLVELLVVVLIIGILSSVALPQYTRAVKKAQGVKVVTAANALVKALNMAYLEDGSYRRSYYLYSGPKGEYYDLRADDFDIEIPRISMNDGWIGVLLEGSGHSTIVRFRFDGSPYFSLEYHLSNGKLDYVSCDGPGCSQYFPGTILSSN